MDQRTIKLIYTKELSPEKKTEKEVQFTSQASNEMQRLQKRITKSRDNLAREQITMKRDVARYKTLIGFVEKSKKFDHSEDGVDNEDLS